MSRNAIAAIAVIFVSGFAGCAATARAEQTPVPTTSTFSVAAPTTCVAPLLETNEHIAPSCKHRMP